MRAQFPDALADRAPCARVGCPLWYAWLLCHGLWAGPARRDLLFCPSELKDTGRFRNLLLHALLKYSSCPVGPGSISCLPRSGHFFFALPAIYGYRSGKLFGELCCHFPALARVLLEGFLAPRSISRWLSGWVTQRTLRILMFEIEF